MARLASRVSTPVAVETLGARTLLGTRRRIDAAHAVVETGVHRAPVGAHVAQRVAVVVLLHRRGLARTAARARAPWTATA